MGFLSWWKGSEATKTTPGPPLTTDNPEVTGMNGAVEVVRPPPSAVTVFEFGSIAASADKVTLSGYCPVTDELDPCRWEILPATDDDAPQFRVVF